MDRRDFLGKSVVLAAALEAMVTEGYAVEQKFEILYTIGKDVIIDTKKNAFYQQRLCADPKKYKFKMNEKEREIVYQSLMNNDIMNISEDLTSDRNENRVISFPPDAISTLVVTLNGETKAIKHRPAFDMAHQFNPDGIRYRAVMKTLYSIVDTKVKLKTYKTPQGCKTLI